MGIMLERNEENKTPEEKPAPQMTFNFNVTGNGNSFYNHVDTVNNYYGGKAMNILMN